MQHASGPWASVSLRRSSETMTSRRTWPQTAMAASRTRRSRRASVPCWAQMLAAVAVYTPAAPAARCGALGPRMTPQTIRAKGGRERVLRKATAAWKCRSRSDRGWRAWQSAPPPRSKSMTPARPTLCGRSTSSAAGRSVQRQMQRGARTPAVTRSTSASPRAPPAAKTKPTAPRTPFSSMKMTPSMTPSFKTMPQRSRRCRPRRRRRRSRTGPRQLRRRRRPERWRQRRPSAALSLSSCSWTRTPSAWRLPNPQVKAVSRR
mmetsp:Transcript_15028/g.45383  ORF Transcript_15028/g.45383 Transcript_15028/m.45383 type:complete len:262 (+) Transcript_15028:1392-2177(+)